MIKSSRSTRMFVALAALVTGWGAQGLAQVTGLPVRNPGVIQGFTIGGDVGFGKISRSGADGDDQSRAFGALATLGFGPVGAALGIVHATIDPAVGPNRSQTTLTAAAQLTVFGGPLVPLKVSWQAGVAKPLDGGDQKAWRGHLGIGAALAIPAVAFSIRPWVAPRLDYLANQPVSGTRFKGAVSAGIDLGLLNGLGLRVGYDSRLGWDNGTEPASGISVGASYHFR
jgi:hypothetical protein